MESTEADDDVNAGRPLPLSRAFAQAGFSRADARRWREAGWSDAATAADWRHLEAWCTPEQLRELERKGFGIAQIERIARSAPRVIAAWRRTLETLDADVSDVEIDLRERVLQNLHRDMPAFRPGEGVPEDDLAHSRR